MARTVKPARLSGFYPVELGVTDFQTDHDLTERRRLAAARAGRSLRVQPHRTTLRPPAQRPERQRGMLMASAPAGARSGFAPGSPACGPGAE